MRNSSEQERRQQVPPPNAPHPARLMGAVFISLESRQRSVYSSDFLSACFIFCINLIVSILQLLLRVLSFMILSLFGVVSCFSFCLYISILNSVLRSFLLENNMNYLRRIF